MINYWIKLISSCRIKSTALDGSSPFYVKHSLAFIWEIWKVALVIVWNVNKSFYNRCIYAACRPGPEPQATIRNLCYYIITIQQTSNICPTTFVIKRWRSFVFRWLVENQTEKWKSLWCQMKKYWSDCHDGHSSSCTKILTSERTSKLCTINKRKSVQVKYITSTY